MALQAHGSVEIGDVNLPGDVGGSGRNIESNVFEKAPRVLVIDGHAGLGSVSVDARHTMTRHVAVKLRSEH